MTHVRILQPQDEALLMGPNDEFHDALYLDVGGRSTEYRMPATHGYGSIGLGAKTVLQRFSNLKHAVPIAQREMAERTSVCQHFLKFLRTFRVAWPHAGGNSGKCLADQSASRSAQG